MDLDLKLGDNFKLKDLSRYTKVNWNSAILILAASPLRFRRSRTPSAASPARSRHREIRHRLQVSSLVSGAAGVSIADPTPLNGNGLAFSRVKPPPM